MNWSVNCSGQVTNALNKYNKKVSELYCGDFSNLFTALPHQDIINNIMEMVKNTFDGNSRMNIQCNMYNSFFSRTNYNNYEEYSLTDVFLMVSFLIKNCYVQFAGNNFLQICGIPQGGRYLLTIIMCDGRKANYGQSSVFCYSNLDGAAYG
ncbi:hypothetical protein DdX_11123 [Ditylenchus destructor]|uniref:Uncharacterized protein n=1 Tax=Ditylenchus destructor TaxID=166010 RepID=A0AAD4N1D5_9BILA|nr:hypothetical protein DdX_11123 [Ditylenchus destructor]